MGDGNGVEITKILYIHVWNGQSIDKTNFFISWSYKFKLLIFLCFQFNFKFYFLINSFVPFHDVVIVFGPRRCRPPQLRLLLPLPSPSYTLCCFCDFYFCILSSSGVAYMDMGRDFTGAWRTHHALHHRGRWHLSLPVLAREASDCTAEIHHWSSGCWVLSPPWDICSIPLRGHHGREDRKK